MLILEFNVMISSVALKIPLGNCQFKSSHCFILVLFLIIKVYLPRAKTNQ